VPFPFSKNKKNRFFAACILLLPVWSVAPAQTLGEQYETYLGKKCQDMNFERDSGSQLLPGQAGPNLFAWCTGPYQLPSGGPSLSDVNLGASGAAMDQGAKDAALRRRRDRARNNPAAEPGDEFSILESGGTSLFFSLDFLRQDQKQTDYQDGRDANNVTLSLGLDHRLGAKGVIGAMARYTVQAGDIDAGGDVESHAAGGTVFGSWYPVAGMFVDVSTNLDTAHAETRRLVAREETAVFPPGPSYGYIDPVTGELVIVTPPPVVKVYYAIPPVLATSDTDSREAGASVQAGYDASFGRLSVGPRAGWRWKKSTTDAFVESGATPMTLAFDKQKQISARTTLGMQTSMATNTQAGVLVTQVNMDWIHEQRSDRKLISARFAEDYRPDPTILRFLTQAPDRDFFEARLSLISVLPNGGSIFVSVSSSFGNPLMNQYGATFGIRAEF
jgi:uncharacterized protein YhjY with autotransporter beta-barrel domain